MRKSIALASILMILGAGLFTQEEAQADYGIAGGTSFANGSVFPFIAGLDSSLSASFYVQNITEDILDLELSHGAPRGIDIVPSEGQATSLDPGEAMTFSFDILVDRTVAAGSYPLIVNLRKADFEPEVEGGSVYLPALSAGFVVNVVGASATVNFRAISSLNGLPAVGDLSLFYLGENGLNTLIFQDSASEYQVNVVPGNYRATFDIPNLQRQSTEFSIGEDEFKDIVLEIPTIEFISVEATPTRDERDVIQNVVLSMDVFNNLRLLGGPIDFVARVTKDGEFIEDFVISTLPNLPEERTLQRATYLREDGFEAGTWSFEFLLRNPDFEVSSGFDLEVPSPGLLQSYFQEIIIALGALVIAGLLMPKRWWAVILRRRSKDEEKGQQRLTLSSIVEFTKSSIEKISAPKPQKAAPAKKAKKTAPQPKPKPVVETPRPAVPIARATEGKDNLPLATGPVSRVPDESSQVMRKAKEFFISAIKRKESDPYQVILENLRKIDAYEDLGARSLTFSYDLDSVFSKGSNLVVSKVTGEPYGEEDLELIRAYKKSREIIREIGRSDLEREARKAILRERVLGRTKGGGE